MRLKCHHEIVLGLTDLKSVVPWPREVEKEHRDQRDDHEGDELGGFKRVGLPRSSKLGA